MKTYDDFLAEYAPAIDAIGDELRQLILSSKKDNPDMTDFMILSSRIAHLRSDRMLRLYHNWLAQQVEPRP